MSLKCTLCNICVDNQGIACEGKGKSNAKIMIVGTNPDYKAKRLNTPYLNKGASLLNRILFLFGFTRDSVYITYAIKCKTQDDREPTERETRNCNIHLQNEIKHVNPSIIILMGKHAICSYFGKYKDFEDYPIFKINGMYIVHDKRIIICTYEPSRIKGDKTKRAFYHAFKAATLVYIELHDKFHRVNHSVY